MKFSFPVLFSILAIVAGISLATGVYMLRDEVVSPSIEEGSKTIFTDEAALGAYVESYGPKATIAHLHELSATMGSCHDVAHRAGRFSYELFGDRAFKECGAECHSGCYHGATEAFFKEHGTADLSENLNILCSSELNPFFSHQCVHGIGHGLMAWTSYELLDALEACNVLSAQQASCYTGVFMENIVGSLGAEEGHATKYLSSDPQYPCNDPKLEEKYKWSCYFLQTSRMMQLFGSDFTKVATACLGAPEAYQRTCFESMGRDVGGTFRREPQAAIAACKAAPEGLLRTGCLTGAVQDAFWDPTGQDDALAFCHALVDLPEKDACYSTIFGRSPDVLVTEDAQQQFCAKAEEEYRTRCQSAIRAR